MSRPEDVEKTPGSAHAIPAADGGMGKPVNDVGIGIQHAPANTATRRPGAGAGGGNAKVTVATLEKLELFRREIGIEPVEDVPRRSRPGKNIGVYAEVIREAKRIEWQYWACASVLNVCLLVQIAIGAVLTALGASKAPHLAIAVLGAVNTVMAGMLTYIKGQGLPYRLLVYLNELKRIRTAVEQKERDFWSGKTTSEDGKEFDVYKEADRLAKMFEDAKKNSEANYPETYMATAVVGGQNAGDLAGGGGHGFFQTDRPRISISSAPGSLQGHGAAGQHV